MQRTIVIHDGEAVATTPFRCGKDNLAIEGYERSFARYLTGSPGRVELSGKSCIPKPKAISGRAMKV